MNKIDNGAWIKILVVVFMVLMVLTTCSNLKSQKDAESQREIAIADSLKKDEERKDSIQYERKMEELRDLREAYNAGLKAGRKIDDEIRDSYLQGYREGLTNFHQELSAVKEELALYKNSREQSFNETSSKYLSNSEQLEVPVPECPQLSDFTEYKVMMDSSSSYTDYSYNEINPNIGELFLGFETDFAFGVPFNNSPNYDTWNYLVLNYMSENWGDKESTSISFGCSGKSRQIRLAKYLYAGKFRMSVMNKLIWDPIAPTVSIVSVGIDYKLKNSPISLYSELGCKFLSGASPFIGFGARINLQKKIWKIK